MFNVKVKAYRSGLDIILQCQPVINIFCEKRKNDSQMIENANLNSSHVTNDSSIQNTENDQVTEEKKQIVDEESLINLLEQRLQFVLRSLIKLYRNNKTTGNHKKV